MKDGYKQVEPALRALVDPKKAAFQKTFFKTGEGQYGAEDKFLGVMVPDVRTLVPRFQHLPLSDCARLLESPYNEVRLLALCILVAQYKGGAPAEKSAIYKAYLANLKGVNNWNLVDASAHYIMGAHLLEKDKKILLKLSKSRNLWERRVAIVATWAFIRAGLYDHTLELSAALLKDNEDLMHKACGWMLREVGKKDVSVLENFLKEHHADMPRTMLRYAIEKFPPARRKKMLKGVF